MSAFEKVDTMVTVGDGGQGGGRRGGIKRSKKPRVLAIHKGDSSNTSGGGNGSEVGGRLRGHKKLQRPTNHISQAASNNQIGPDGVIEDGGGGRNENR